jgi:hypothetical protein
MFVFKITPAIVLCVLLASCGVFPSFNAAMTLEGEVKDQDGNALEQVHLGLRTSRFDLMSESFTSKDESVLELGDGRFHVSCRTCSGMTLHFSKDGYYSETMNFHVEKGEMQDGRRSGEEAQNLVRTDVEIVLRSDENEATLVRYESTLSSAADGPLRVAPLRRDLGSRGVLLEHLSKPPSRAAQYLPGYVRLRAALDDEGTLAARPLPDVPGARMRFPASAVLDFAEADGGIIFYQFADGDPKKTYRSMRTAPSDGYEPSLALDTANRDGTSYFYCRIGNLYGKGRVAVPSFGHTDAGQEVVMAYMEIRLNLDGTRNVETGR